MTKSVRGNENVPLLRQAWHVPSEGPARYRSAAWHYALFLTWNIRMRIGLGISWVMVEMFS